ncbi:hypothetical protein V6N13_149601 [Hibiscus sabdariffa]|uniref:S-protein homolog n=1 Tax=Hibiscus sabdariffa TaxID=183260 RepID=A0ABR2EIN1_9ROSI
MSSFCINMLLFLVLTILVAANPSTPTSSAPTPDQRNAWYTKWHVHVVNGLSNNKILFVHCKSADDDLEMNNLTVGSETEWTFRTTIIGKTLFWCYVASRSDHVHARFDVFWEDNDLFEKCAWKHCIWTAKDDGIYLMNVPQSDNEFVHNWEWDSGLLANSPIV